MSEDMLARVRAERERSYEALLATCGGHLQMALEWTERGLSHREIAARMRALPPLGAETVTAYQRLTATGVPDTDAAAVAAEVAAVRAKRTVLGAPEQAEAVAEQFDTLTRALRRGQDARSAVAEFRGAIAGWRGDGVTEDTDLGAAILVDFGDEVVPDGREVAGVRETGPRHALVTPGVEAGIDAYVAARDRGVEHLDALKEVPPTPGAAQAVAHYADLIERGERTPQQARSYARGLVVAEAAVGQFLSLRGTGMSVEDAAAVAAGGEPAAVHAIGWFVAESRTGYREDIGAADAAFAAAQAAEDIDGYAGLLRNSSDLPGYSEARDTATAALSAHVAGTGTAPADEVGADAVRRFGWLTGLGVDAETATRLAAADVAEGHAQRRRAAESDAILEAEEVLDAALVPDEVDPATEELQQRAFEGNYDAVDAAVRQFERQRGHGETLDAARDMAVRGYRAEQQDMVAAALDAYLARLAEGFDHKTALDLSAQDAEENTAATESTSDTVTPPEGEDIEAPLGERVAECARAVDTAENAVHRADISDEDHDRADRCARWNNDDQASAQDDDINHTSDGWEQQ